VESLVDAPHEKAQRRERWKANAVRVSDLCQLPSIDREMEAMSDAKLSSKEIVTAKVMESCAECGMLCEVREYHPFAACLMYKACHNSATVRANLEAVRTSDEPCNELPDETPTTDDLLRNCWRAAGGEFHGPNVETGTMPEAKLLSYLRHLYQQIFDLRTAQPPDAGIVQRAVKLDPDQYRCMPEKQVYCPHMDAAHGLLAEWLIAWDQGTDNADTYRRTSELLSAALTKSESL
jgi:hypothetical protein